MSVNPAEARSARAFAGLCSQGGRTGEYHKRFAGLIGHAEIYVSGGAEHQGPDGGGPVALIVDRSLA